MWYLMIHICLRRRSWGRLKLIIIKDLYCWNCCIHLFSKTSTGSSNFNILCRVCIQVQRYYNYIRLLPANNIELRENGHYLISPIIWSHCAKSATCIVIKLHRTDAWQNISGKYLHTCDQERPSEQVQQCSVEEDTLSAAVSWWHPCIAR